MLVGNIENIKIDFSKKKTEVYISLDGVHTYLQDLSEIECEIDKPKTKRSLNANNYAWVLMQEIAKKVGTTKEEVYRDLIRSYGDFVIVCVPEKAVGLFRTKWESNGVGWVTETQDSKLPKCKNIFAYYGTSTYDTKQMARLIEGILAECEALDIPTKNENEIKSLLESWNEKI